MANALANIFSLFSSKPIPKVSAYQEAGVSGTSIFGGRVQITDRNAAVQGAQRWITYSDLVANSSIVAAGVRYFLNLVASSKWSVESVDDTPDAKAIAEFIEEVINDTVTPWSRIMRRASMYRFHGFGIQEWTAKKRMDGKIGLDDIEARPQHTIERWEVDERGTVTGVWQRSPQTGEFLGLPRNKVLYLVEDSLSDSPEGLGLFRHLVDPFERLKLFLTLEGQGFERDLRGIPIGRAPYAAIKSAVDAGSLSKEDAASITRALEDFVKVQVKSADTALCLDSSVYVAQTTTGQAISSTPQWAVELLQGQTSAFGDLNNSINRLNREMARVLNVEHLLLGDSSAGGSRALSEDKSRNLWLTVNGALDEIGEGAKKDVVTRVCDLNGIADEMRPGLKHSDVAFRSVQEITAALRDLATAGGVLAPTDPAINDVRDLLGVSRQPDDVIDQGNLIPVQTGGEVLELPVKEA